MRSNNIIILHFTDTKNPVVIDIDKICAMYKTDVKDVTTTTVYVGDWIIAVEEPLEIILQKIKTVENWVITTKEPLEIILQEIKTVENNKNKEIEE